MKVFFFTVDEKWFRSYKGERIHLISSLHNSIGAVKPIFIFWILQCVFSWLRTAEKKVGENNQILSNEIILKDLDINAQT